ncbi:MAG TPA: hypothetical protein PKA64_00890 [Myxococcota bacterium]|nr:hypothetical protein [Myxococcota bacterium]
MLRRVQILVLRGVARNVDLLAIWLALLVAALFVPVTHPLARADLLPWMVLTLSVVGFIRGRRFGAGPHPMLTPRVDTVGSLAMRVAYAAAPWALLFVYDAARFFDAKYLGYAAAACGVLIIAEALGSAAGQTAWQPVRGAPVVETVSGAVFLIAGVAGAGYLTRVGRDMIMVTAPARALVIGLGFLAIGLIAARIQNHRQRVAAGRKDSTPYRSLKFPAFLAVFGPTYTFSVVFVIVRGLDFDQSFVASLLVVVWAAIVWAEPSPIMVSCVLHEVLPTGGADPRPTGGQAQGFDAPPEGALRFSPLRTRRTLVMHPWLVPVRSSRIAELDDPVRPLWDEPPPLLTDHILGDAAFEPDPITRQDQWEVLTIRLRGRADVQSMGGDAQTRRMVILRAFPAPGTSGNTRLATYRWEELVPEQTVQVLDPTTEVAQLRDGDILVLSAEGVARAFEIEIGAPVYRVADALQFRAPQIEDYVEAG